MIFSRVSNRFYNLVSGFLSVLLSLSIVTLFMASSAVVNAAVTNTSPKESLTNKRILLLYSYHPTFPSAPQVYDGIKEYFADNSPVIDIEYMDSKRVYDDVSRELFLKGLTYKLSKRPAYDLVITADDNALDFITEHKDVLLPGVPAVFLGVNSVSRAMKAGLRDDITGVVEAVSIIDTLRLGQTLLPDAKAVNIIVDGTKTSQANYTALREVQPQFKGLHFNVMSLESLTWHDLKRELSKLSPTDFALHLSAYSDAQGVTKEFNDVISLIVDNSSAPVMHLWDHGFGDGILGGKVISFNEQGRAAAEMAEDVLTGTDIKVIPVSELSPNIAILDWRVMQRYKINDALAPSSVSVQFNRISIFEKYGREVLVVMLLIGFLLLVIAYLIRQNRLNDQLSGSLVERETTLRAILDNIDAFVYMKDLNGRYLFANKAVRQLFNARLDQIVGYDDDKFFDKTTAANIRKHDMQVINLGNKVKVEETNTPVDGGETRIYDSTKLPLYNEKHHTYALCGISVDITEQRNHQEELEFLAHNDSLTGLPNRLLLADRLKQAMSNSDRTGRKLAVVYMDLDGFKQINDRYGHEVGDQLLQQVSQRCKTVIRESDTFSRLGGDEFVAVLVNLDDQRVLLDIVARLLELMSQPVVIDSRSLQVAASAGISLYEKGDELDADQLVRKADQAMYSAKTQGGNRYHFFDSEIERGLVEREKALSRVKQGLENEEFVLYYQPKINMRTGEVIGLEALIRWQHPEQGLVFPDAFLPTIETHELSVDVGDWVIGEALRQVDEWQKQGYKLSVSVNVSNMQLERLDFADKVLEGLSCYPTLSPHQIELEILESGALQNTVLVSEAMRKCHEGGVHFALDDFGTAYSSLMYLKQLPAKYLKIDRGFVRDMLVDTKDLAILQSIIGLGDAFNMVIIAEGVETIEHGVALLELDCELAQGYVIARPMPAEQVISWIDDFVLPQEWRRD